MESCLALRGNDSCVSFFFFCFLLLSDFGVACVAFPDDITSAADVDKTGNGAVHISHSMETVLVLMKVQDWHVLAQAPTLKLTGCRL
jgi:hypothetical protein